MLYSTTFLTLDGVMSHPEVWHPAYASDESMALLAEHLDTADAMLIRTLLDEGLIDEMRFYLDPIVVGEDLRLFADNTEQISFELTDQRMLPNGVTYLAYRPVGRSHG